MALLLLLAASLVGAAPVAGSDARADIPAVLDEAERAVAAIEGRYVRIRWADRLVDARIAAGDFDGAVRAAHHMPADADEHQQALGRAWGARYVAGDAAAVMRLAQPLRLYALADAARRHVEQRRFDEALAIARSIEPPHGRLWVLMPLAEAQLAAGDLESALRSASLDTTCCFFGEIAGQVAERQAQAGDADAALRTARRAKARSRDAHDNVLVGVMVGQARTGDLAGAAATAIAVQLEHGYDPSIVHVFIGGHGTLPWKDYVALKRYRWTLVQAEHRARAGDPRGALGMAMAAPNPHPGSSLTALPALVVRIARARAAARDAEAVAWLLALVDDRRAEAGVLRDLAVAQAAAGDLAAALATTGRIRERHTRDEALQRIAIFQAQRGATDDAARTAAPIVGRGYLPPAVHAAIAEAHFRAGRLDEATRSAMQSGDAEIRARVAAHHAHRGDTWTALRAAGGHIESFRRIAVTLVEIGDVEGAERLVAQWPHHPDIAHGVAAARARAGDVQPALAWAAALAWPQARAAALLGVAETLLAQRTSAKRVTENSVRSASTGWPSICAATSLAL